MTDWFALAAGIAFAVWFAFVVFLPIIIEARTDRNRPIIVGEIKEPN